MIRLEKKGAIVQSLGFVALSKCAGLFKISLAIGCCSVFFSASNFLTPLSGAVGGVTVATGAFVVSIVCKLFNVGLPLSLSYLTYHIPSYCASLFWAIRSPLFRATIPALSMILFLAHPVGMHAPLYASLWFIPLVAAFFHRDNLWITALGSTFTAHAVGSVIWIYTTPMPAAAWYAMIPQVLVERILFASGMVVAYHVIAFTVRFFKAIRISKMRAASDMR